MYHELRQSKEEEIAFWGGDESWEEGIMELRDRKKFSDVQIRNESLY